MKRCFDLIVSALVLLLLSPLLILVSVILKFTGEKEAFYFQERIGLQGKVFYITKFVTMVKNSASIGSGDITLKNDSRVLPVGRVLRKTKLNEVPQFWDVLVGKLSLVGWRPLMKRGFDDYSPAVQAKIVQVKPGLTGIGSLVFRDEEGVISLAQSKGLNIRDCYRDHIMAFKGDLECWYIDNHSLWTDLKIVTATAISVLIPNWKGYQSWFPGLPRPTSALICEHFGIAK